MRQELAELSVGERVSFGNSKQILDLSNMTKLILTASRRPVWRAMDNLCHLCLFEAIKMKLTSKL